CGSIGRRHLNNLRALGMTDLVACDPSPAARASAAASGAMVTYSDHREAIARHPDAVAAVVCTPTSIHLGPALDLADRGLHLLIEKPLATRVEGAAALVALVESKGRTGMMAMCYRFHPGLRLINSLLERRQIGRVYSARVSGGHYLPDWHPQVDYRKEYAARADQGGGVLLTSVIHTLDYLRWFFGECRSVQCLVGKVSGLEIDTDDMVVGHFVTDEGVVAQLYCDFLQRNRQHQIEIVGETGTIRWEYAEHSVDCFQDGAWQRLPYTFDPNQMYLDEMRTFLACAAGTDVPPVSLAEGLHEVAILEAMRESSRSGAVQSLPGSGEALSLTGRR
ncbi:MAG: Gfo/Idh/MocA family oxidoreductase, partial [Nitrospirota bacterium]|nr:Gfo/Idh/MocA family oxidoreductase [Nitrospirota bacterium]